MARKKKVEEITSKDSDVFVCKVNKTFSDKYTGEIYEEGKEYEFTLKRIKEIQAKNKEFIEIKK